MAHTRVIDALRDAIKDQTFTVKGGATFGPDEYRNTISVNTDITTHTEWGEGWKNDNRRDVIGRIELTLWGRYTYRDDVDRSARVMITHYFGQSVGTRAYVKAERWNGTRHESMPEGGRDKIAAEVLAFVMGVFETMNAGGDVWERLTREHLATEHARVIDAELGKVRDAQRRADELSARGPRSLPFAGGAK